MEHFESISLSSLSLLSLSYKKVMSLMGHNMIGRKEHKAGTTMTIVLMLPLLLVTQNLFELNVLYLESGNNKSVATIIKWCNVCDVL